MAQVPPSRTSCNELGFSKQGVNLIAIKAITKQTLVRHYMITKLSAHIAFHHSKSGRGATGQSKCFNALQR